jgi:gas vesicle protein
MQIGLDQIIQVIMQRLEGIEMSVEDIKFRTNIALRLLRKNDLMQDEDLETAVKNEYTALTELESEEIEMNEEQIKQISKGILQWVDNDLEEMKEKIRDYHEKMKEMMEKENNKSDISVAPADLINRLDGMKKSGNDKKGGKIIL